MYFKITRWIEDSDNNKYYEESFYGTLSTAISCLTKGLDSNIENTNEYINVKEAIDRRGGISPYRTFYNVSLEDGEITIRSPTNFTDILLTTKKCRDN